MNNHLTHVVRISEETYEAMKKMAEEATERNSGTLTIDVDTCVEVACKYSIEEDSPMGRQVTLRTRTS